MRDSSLNRWMWLIGLLAVVALFVGFGPLSGGAPGENASGLSVANWYNSHVGQSWASIYLVALGLVLTLVFVTQLHSILRDIGGEQLWPNVTFAAAIILVSGVVVAGSFQITLILAAHNHEYGIVKVANFVGDNDEILFLFGVFLLTLSTALAILLNRAGTPLPRTLGWYSLLVAVVSAAGPVSFFAILFGLPIWIIATGFVVATKARRGTLGPAAHAPRMHAPQATQPVTG